MSKQESAPTFRYKHGQVYSNARPKCPVCHQPVYSRTGIHPQCAAEQGDKEAVLLQKAEAAAKSAAEPAGEPGQATPPKRPVYGRGWQRTPPPKS